MTLSKSALAFATALLVVPAAAYADTTPGWYISGATGVNFSQEANVKTSAGDNNVSFDQGVSLAGSGGYAFDNGIRAEAELFYDRPNVDTISAISNANGHLSNVDLFANGLYDFQTGTMFTPYIGAGVGLAFVSAKNVGALASGGYLNESDSTNFAYQAIVGAAAQLDKNWALSVDYRYVGTDDPKLKLSTGGSPAVTDDQHNVMVSLRYSFGEPAAPAMETTTAPRPVAKAAAKTVVAEQSSGYVVFFDFNRTELTPEAKRIIASAADAYRKGGYAKLIVTGHTDTVGSDRYNDKLSEKRAAIVKAELNRLGIDSKAIVAKGEGKKDPLVSTPNNVREVHNRRAEIVLSN